MYLPDEAARIVRRFIADPKAEVRRILIGAVAVLLSLPLLHLFMQGTFSLADFLNSL